MSALMETQGASVAYGPRRVVDGVSFALEAGQALGVVGESGAGKSSLLRVLAGLTPLADGKLFWRGRDISRSNPVARRRAGVRIGLVFQDPYASLNPRLPLWAIVTEQERLDGERDNAKLKRNAQAHLERVQLDPAMMMRRPQALSGGQRQRIAIARALAGAPELLLLDEPTSALDVTVQANTLALLGGLRRELGLAVLMISHDLFAVRALCDDILIMRAGKVVEAGPKASIFAAPKAAYTKELIAATPMLGARAELAP